MQIKDIIKNNQPEVFDKLSKCKEQGEKHLSHHDFEKMMQHDSYRRGKGGAVRQVRHG